MSTPIRSTTQLFVEIADITDDIVIMLDGSCAIILETGAVNFGLLSKEEQDAIIFAFASFLNSLSFPIQIVIMSKRMDVSEYLNYINQEQQKQKSIKLKEKLRSYYQYILSLVRENTVLEKRFFLVIPFSSLELGVKSTKSAFKRPKKLPYKKEYIIERARTTLLPKRDHIMRQITRMGLKATPLTTPRLVSLFYEIYNPESEEGQRIAEGVEAPIVQPLKAK